jgi:hypothetical protein
VESGRVEAMSEPKRRNRGFGAHRSATVAIGALPKELVAELAIDVELPSYAVEVGRRAAAEAQRIGARSTGAVTTWLGGFFARARTRRFLTARVVAA